MLLTPVTEPGRLAEAKTEEAVFVVLGVHRGGTSALAKGLDVLGVSLGDNLMPPAPGNNETGFWEDLDIVELNEAVFVACRERWHSLRLFDERDADPEAFEALIERGCELIEAKRRRFPRFGFKDPRTPRLLFYWKRVFERLRVEPRYLIATRHPLSVARSLDSRDRFTPAKSYVLWLQHMACALKLTEGERRIVADYDRVIASPVPELLRIGEGLELQPASEAGLEAYASEFLSSDLRHSLFDFQALEQDLRVPRLAVAMFGSLTRMASDEISPDDEEVSALVDRVWGEMADLAPAFDLAESGVKVAEYAENVADRLLRVAPPEPADGAEETEAEAGAEIDHLRYGAVALEAIQSIARRLEELEATSVERTQQVSALTETVHERDESIRVLDLANAEQARRIEDLEAAVVERDESIHQLGARASQLERDLRSSTEPIARRLHEVTLELENLRGSSFWRATRPFRQVWRWVEVRVFGHGFRFKLRPNHELEALGGDSRWRSVGSDPGFDMLPTDGIYPAGWVTVRSNVQRKSKDLNLKLYYDSGDGLGEYSALQLPVTRMGTVRQLVRLPKGIKALRWDPMQSTGEFIQKPIVISRTSLLRRVVHRFLRVRSLIQGRSPTELAEQLVSWRNLLLDPQPTYERASRLRNYVPERSYAAWLYATRITDEDREAIRADIRKFRRRPLISIVMPVFNTPPRFLRAAIDSVRNQLYEDWELCIADDCSTDPEVGRILNDYSNRDERIRVEFRRENGHISAASNTALTFARGEFVALLDHDDLLVETALYYVAHELNRHPNTDILYSDEDKIDENEQRFEPHFKPDWNPDFLLSQNYVSHLGVYRTSLVQEVGGFRVGFEGAQDFDLLLRCVAASPGPRVRHIPVVLYHWRSISGSTARDEQNKGYATAAGISALESYFSAKGMDGVSVEQGPYRTSYRLRYPLPRPAPKVSLIIPTRDGHEILRTCIDSIRSKTTYPDYEIVVVDNQSSDPRSLRYLQEIEASGVRVLRYDHPFNYSAVNNFAVERANGTIVGLINNDIEVISPDWLTEMVSLAVRPGTGAVGAKLYYPNDTIQHAGVVIGIGGVAGHSHKYYPRNTPGYFRRLALNQNLSAVTGACLVVRKDVYQEAGGLDAENLAVAFNDVDFCLKLCDLGLRNVWTPFAELYHHESLSRGHEDSPEKVARFQKEVRYMLAKWGERLLFDPCYSPMLTRADESFRPDFDNLPPQPWLAAGANTGTDATDGSR